MAEQSKPRERESTGRQGLKADETLLAMSKQDLFDMFSRMGQEAGDVKTVSTSQLAAEAILDESW